MLRGSVGFSLASWWKTWVVVWVRLTNEVLLAGSNLKRGEADDSRDDGKGTKAEGEGDTSRLLEDTLSEKNERDSVANKVASQVESEVEDEGLRGVEHW
jgi:hypothetical protein